MKQILTYSLIFTLLFLGACKKNKLPEVVDSGPPVFYVKCLVNGVPVNIEAGLNNYVMEPSFYKDNNQLYVYKSEFKQKCDANICGYQFTVLINDYKFADSAGNSMNAEKALVPGSYSFGNGSSDPLYYTATFTPLSPLNADYKWYFSDGSNMSGATVSKTLASNRTYNVSMYNNNSSNSCTISTTHVYNVGNPLQTHITAINMGGTKYAFSASTSNSGPYTYLWHFDDGTTSTEANPEHTYPSQAYFTPTLTLTDGNSNVCIANYQISPRNNCEANFVASFIPVKNTAALSNITILVKDQAGAIYSSSSVQQLSDSKFEIVSIEDYASSEKGEKTKKIKINFSCKVKDGNNTISITNGEAILAAAYK